MSERLPSVAVQGFIMVSSWDPKSPWDVTTAELWARWNCWSLSSQSFLDHSQALSGYANGAINAGVGSEADHASCILGPHHSPRR